MDKQRREQKRVSFLPPPSHPSCTRAGENLRSLTSPFPLSAPNGRETTLILALLSLFALLSISPVWGPLPATGVRAKDMDTVGDEGRSGVPGDPLLRALSSPGALSRSPPNAEASGAEQPAEALGVGAQASATCPSRGSPRPGREWRVSAGRGEGGRSGRPLLAEEGARPGASLPAAAAAARPSSGSRRAGGAARGMTALRAGRALLGSAEPPSDPSHQPPRPGREPARAAFRPAPPARRGF